MSKRLNINFLQYAKARNESISLKQEIEKQNSLQPKYDGQNSTNPKYAHKQDEQCTARKNLDAFRLYRYDRCDTSTYTKWMD